MFNEIKEAIKKRLNKKENADSKLKKVNVDRMEVIDSDQIGYVSDEIIFGTTSRPTDVGRILRTFKIKKNVEVTDNGKIII